MRLSQLKISQKSSKIIDIKEIDYFKQILKINNDLFLKELIPLAISKINAKHLDHEHFIYIPEQEVDGCLVHKIIQNTVHDLSKKATLIRISKNFDIIMKEIFMLKIPVLQHFKTQDRFFFLNECQTKIFPFNRILLRKGDYIDGIYFIVKGEVKLSVDKVFQKEKLLGSGNFICLEELAGNKMKSNYTVISNTNQCLALFISLELLKKTTQEEEISLKDLFVEYYKKNDLNLPFHFPKNHFTFWRKSWKQPKSAVVVKFNDFNKRSREFKDSTTGKDENFNNYVETKKIILKLHETIKTKSGTFRESSMQKMLDAWKKPSTAQLASNRSGLYRDIILRKLSKIKTKNY